MEKIKGTVTQLVNVRLDKPTVRAKRAPALPIGTVVEISHAIRGEMYKEVDIWYVMTNQTFVWSGAINASSDVPFIEKKLIVTADDIGVVDDIDMGAKVALRYGRINSIAVFVNRPNDTNGDYLKGWYDFLRSYERVGDSRKLYETTHVGLHFTITSGEPVSNPQGVGNLLNGKYFRKYTDFDTDYEREAFVDQIKAELDAQYEKFKAVFKRKPDHLTSHHDILTFNKPLFRHMQEWSQKNEVPLRTHKFLPSAKRFWYDTLVITDIDLPSIDKMNQWEEEFGSKVEGAQHTIVDHYGPLPPFAVINYLSQVKKKQGKLEEWLFDFLVSKDHTREIVIHLLKTTLRRQRDLVRSYKDVEASYPGVNIKHFDGRVAEYLSLQKGSPWKSDPSLSLSPVVVSEA
ncbi:MAG: ChbG/HpnK family deacetylase [Imperialibacter sp.]|uniref:ChbG/HpnK family deacetylase n=1 Tax=Imperialibacter sp. TaxID=2038411 RepID=UPI0032F062CD